MKKAFVLGAAAVAVLTFGSGCWTPLMNAKVSRIEREAGQYGYARVYMHSGETLFVPRGVAAQIASEEDLVRKIRQGEIHAIDGHALAKRVDPSGVAWRQFGDASINATAAAAVTGGLVWGAGKINDSSSRDYSMRQAATTRIDGDGNTVIIQGPGNLGNGSRDSVSTGEGSQSW